jgi:hypothetical protein
MSDQFESLDANEKLDRIIGDAKNDWDRRRCSLGNLGDGEVAWHAEVTYVKVPIERSARQDSASSSSSLRWPGTMATGMGKSPAFLARLETSGPGPFLLVDDEAEAAEHVARHPEDVGRTVKDFNW